MFLWWQVARHDPERGAGRPHYMATIAIAQVGWIALAVLALPVGAMFAAASSCWSRSSSPARSSPSARRGTPWHPHHIAERYGLLVIITLGEVILGTVAALNAVVHGEAGWTVDAALLAVAGVGLTFGCGGCTSRCPGPSCWSATASGPSSSATATC